MGSGSFSTSAYRAYASTTTGKTTDEIYTSRDLDKSLDPKGVKIRESRDSKDNPRSTPLIVALDVTGSMGVIADALARQGLGVMFESVLDRKPITDPHVMFMGIGDANHDQAPLQVSQFEADNRIVEQLTKLWLEHGGGGNNFESYNLAWYFAARHTEHDSLIKRGKRGYLFTIGDEQAPEDLTKNQIKEFIGDTPQDRLDTASILAEAQRMYDVFHIIIEQGDYATHHKAAVIESWRELLGQHVINLSDYSKVAETIVSTIEVSEGRDAKAVTATWGPAVYNAVKHLPPSKRPKLALKEAN